jgi:hypothetical protein
MKIIFLIFRNLELVVSRAAPQPITGRSRKNWFFATSTPGSTQHHTFQVVEGSIHLFSQLPEKMSELAGFTSGVYSVSKFKTKNLGEFQTQRILFEDSHRA